MVREGDRVKARETGQTGKVIRVVTKVRGIVLNRPIAVIRLEDPDPYGVTLTTEYTDELEAEEPGSERVMA